MPLTVGQIYADLGRIIAQGGKDKILLLTNDEEANGYHAAFFSADNDPKSIKAVMETVDFDSDYDPRKVVLLG